MDGGYRRPVPLRALRAMPAQGRLRQTLGKCNKEHPGDVRAGSGPCQQHRRCHPTTSGWAWTPSFLTGVETPETPERRNDPGAGKQAWQHGVRSSTCSAPRGGRREAT